MGNKASIPKPAADGLPISSSSVQTAVVKVDSPAPSVPVVASVTSLAPSPVATATTTNVVQPLPAATLPGTVTFVGPSKQDTFQLNYQQTIADYSLAGFTHMSIGTGVFVSVKVPNGMSNFEGPTAGVIPNGAISATLTNKLNVPVVAQVIPQGPTNVPVVAQMIPALPMPPASTVVAQVIPALPMPPASTVVAPVMTTQAEPDSKALNGLFQRFAQILVNSYFALLREAGTDRLFITTLPIGTGRLVFLNAYLSNVALSDQYILGTNRDGSIYAADIGEKTPLPQFYKVPGGALQVAVAGRQMWIVNSAGDIYTCPDGCKNGQWTKIPGQAWAIGVVDGRIVIRGIDNNIYICTQPCTGNWVKETASSPTMLAPGAAPMVLATSIPKVI